jgi:Tol biopolymer transport system component
MSDIRTRLRDADRIPAPDLWPEVLSREPSGPPPQPLGPRVLAGVVALTVVALAVLLVARTFLREGLGPSGSGSPSPSASPVLKANGRIAFVRIDPKTAGEGKIPKAALYTVNPDGTGLTRLADVAPASAPAWSPDGTRIAFFSSSGKAPGIFVMNADGTNLTRLTSCDSGKGCSGEGSPAWSPDGTRLAFWSDRDGREGLWTVNADGSGLGVLGEGLSFGPPAWSPDGRLIAVNGNTVDQPEKRGIFLVNARSGRVDRSIFPKGLEPSFGVAWSPDGKWLAFDSTAEGGRPEGAGIYLVRPDGKDLRLLASQSCPSAPCQALSPAWSPNGKELAFTRGGNEPGPSGLYGDLFVIELDTGEIRQLTRGPDPDCCPSWQPLPQT